MNESINGTYPIRRGVFPVLRIHRVTFKSGWTSYIYDF